MKLRVNRPGRNGKLAARRGSIRRRLKDKIYYPRVVTSRRLVWQKALKERSTLEREAYWATHPDKEAAAYALQSGWPMARLEEKRALELFKTVPTVFAIMERIRPGYSRPLWAEQRYGAN